MAKRLSRQSTIERILRDMIKEGGFGGAVVASSDGLPASIKDLAKRAHQELDEISLRDKKGKLVVSRYFFIVAPQGQYNLLLAVQVPAKRPYRRLVNQAVKRIQQVWSD